MIFRHQPKEAKVLSTFSNICVILARYCIVKTIVAPFISNNLFWRHLTINKKVQKVIVRNQKVDDEQYNIILLSMYLMITKTYLISLPQLTINIHTLQYVLYKNLFFPIRLPPASSVWPPFPPGRPARRPPFPHLSCCPGIVTVGRGRISMCAVNP